MTMTDQIREAAKLPAAERRALARKRTLARIRSLREQANRLERLLEGKS